MVLRIILADILLVASIFPCPCGARKNTTQLVKYPRVLSVKPSNKVYLLAITSLGNKGNTTSGYQIARVYLKRDLYAWRANFTNLHTRRGSCGSSSSLCAVLDGTVLFSFVFLLKPTLNEYRLLLVGLTIFQTN